MSKPYRCPNCQTNRSRFNVIPQTPDFIKKDPRTGEIVETYTESNLEPFHLSYNGPAMRVQCASCGLIEDEKTFIAFGER